MHLSQAENDVSNAAAILEECLFCDGTAVTWVDDGDGYMDDVVCHRCINGWVDSDGNRPRRDLAEVAAAKHNPKVREY